MNGLAWVLYPDGIYLLEISRVSPPVVLMYFPNKESLELFIDNTREFVALLNPEATIPEPFRRAFDD